MSIQVVASRIPKEKLVEIQELTPREAYLKLLVELFENRKNN
ncbi:hypothetical protein [Ferdinandcohnia sp. SAFN-114]